MSNSLCSFLSVTPNSNQNSHAPPKFTTISSILQPYCICTHCNHLLPFNHHVGNVAEQETNNNMQAQPSSRWSPTPVQLLVLEELYRQGMKTPSAEQIQQIASQLRQFGKIEGKNVFYWFQNHKARERQKRRRREMEETTEDYKKDKDKCVMGNSEMQEVAAIQLGMKERGKETKKWATTSNCSEHAEDIAEKGSKIEEMQRNSQNIEIPYYLAPITMPTSNSTYYNTPQNYDLLALNKENLKNNEDYPARTLDLFPVKEDEQDCVGVKKSMFCVNDAFSMDTTYASNQFFEFLPLRN